MENPFKNFNRKDWLYVGGAVASLVAVAYLISRTTSIAIPPGAHTDVQNDPTASLPGGSSPGYTNYNTGSWGSPPIMAGSDTTAPPPQVAGCGCESDCAGGNPLGTGSTFGGLDALLTYYQNTNPNYVALQEANLQQYAAYFATGETYARGGVTVGVDAISPVGA